MLSVQQVVPLLRDPSFVRELLQFVGQDEALRRETAKMLMQNEPLVQEMLDSAVDRARRDADVEGVLERVRVGLVGMGAGALVRARLWRARGAPP